MERKWTKAQENAMELRGQTLLISAAAGSGKTATLTERIIRALIGDGEHPGADLSRMLIVTFTRAAAAELKARISQALTDAIAKDPGNKHLTQQLLHLGDAQICTIDSFYLEPVRTHFAELGLPPQFRMADTPELLPLQEDLMLELMNTYYDKYTPGKTDPEKPLDRLRDNTFAAMLDHISPNRNGEMKTERLLLNLYEHLIRYPEGIGRMRKTALLLEREADTDFLKTQSGAPLRRELIGALTSARLFFDCACADLAADPQAAPYLDAFEHDKTAVCALLECLEAGGDYETLRAMLADYAPQRLKPVRNPDRKAELDALKAMRTDQTKMLSAWTSANGKMAASQAEITVQMQKTAEICRLLSAFLKDFDTQYRALKAKRGICDFDDPRRFMLELLRTPDGDPTPFAAELAGQYDEVYIDEYQDVDEMQDLIFSIIGGNHRFMVGDIKQSIYGFRGAEPSVFAGYRRALPAYPGTGDEEGGKGHSIFMSENFRCDSPVIDFTNLVCGFAFSACKESINYQTEDDLICSKKNPAGTAPIPVNLILFEKRAADPTADEATDLDEPVSDKSTEGALAGEAIWVANEIARLLRTEKKNDGTPIQPGDIAILLRNSTHMTDYEEALDALGIPCLVAGAHASSSDGELSLLCALLEVIDNPQSDVPLECVLTSDLFGMTLEDLIKIRQGAGASFSLFGALRRLAAEEETDAAPVAACRAFSEWLTKWQRVAVTRSADQLIRQLWRDERLAAHADSDAAFLLYDYARQYQGTAYNSLYSFLRYFKRIRDDGRFRTFHGDTVRGTVSLLSIHNSKGLEYPVCFVAGLGTRFNHDDENADLIFHPKTGLSTKLYSAETMIKTDTAMRQSAALLLRHDQCEEEIRILYVALTRARERLYLTGSLTGTAEKARRTAAWTRRDDPYRILHADKALDWVLEAIEANPVDAANCCRITVEDKNAQVPGAPLTEVTAGEVTIDPAIRHYRDVLEAQKKFTYPEEYIRKIPGKINASAASLTWLEERDAERNAPITQSEAFDLENERSKWMHDAHQFLYAGELTPGKPTGAQRGTALHAFLQFCDWHRIAEYGAANEAERLVDRGFLRRCDVDLIDPAALSALEDSDLLHLILGAVQITREYRFSRILPLTDFTSSDEMRERYGNETVFLQGSLDLLLKMPGGDLILCDYKTDRILSEENETPERYAARMREKHGMQLKLYADAVEAIFGKRPIKTYVYSVPLRQLILLSQKG